MGPRPFNITGVAHLIASPLGRAVQIDLKSQKVKLGGKVDVAFTLYIKGHSEYFVYGAYIIPGIPRELYAFVRV